MRATTTSDHDSVDPAENFLRTLDQFAALRAYSNAQPAIGGYRILSSQRLKRETWLERLVNCELAEKLRHAAPEATERFADLCAIASAQIGRQYSTIAAAALAGGGRVRASGLLSVLLIGGVAVAVLSGPSSCACSTPSEQAERERLGYIQNAALISERNGDAVSTVPPASPDDLAFLDSDRPLQASEPTVTAAMAQGIDAQPAPETTASITPASVKQATALEALPVEKPAVVAALDAHQIASINEDQSSADAGVARLSTDGAKPHGATAKSDDDDGDKRHVRSARKRGAVRAYRTPVHQVKRQRKKKATNAHLAQRAPAWAQQMYATTWHSQAFSYAR